MADQEVIALLPSLYEKENAMRINIFDDKLLIGRVMLFVVAFLWGTYSPALKYIYTIPGAPIPSVLIFTRASLTSLLLLVTNSSFKNNSESNNIDIDLEFDDNNVSRDSYDDNLDSSKKNGGEMGIFGKFLNYSPNSLILCALEIGLWNFMGDACQSIGLGLTSATRSSFLIQTATLFTPILAYISGKYKLTCIFYLIDDDGGNL